ncbi:hypothetical protein CS542_09055 [Pedobacter sp. IW39]|nr:hypothetical protein CS542_09055 [Pedobacter sp. IW39]
MTYQLYFKDTEPGDQQCFSGIYSYGADTAFYCKAEQTPWKKIAEALLLKFRGCNAGYCGIMIHW